MKKIKTCCFVTLRQRCKLGREIDPLSNTEYTVTLLRWDYLVVFISIYISFIKKRIGLKTVLSVNKFTPLLFIFSSGYIKNNFIFTHFYFGFLISFRKFRKWNIQRGKSLFFFHFISTFYFHKCLEDSWTSKRMMRRLKKRSSHGEIKFSWSVSERHTTVTDCHSFSFFNFLYFTMSCLVSGTDILI